MTVELTVTSITVQPEISAANVVITPTFTSGGGLTAPILSISKNGVNIEPDELKNVDIEVPTKTSDLTNDSDFVVDAYYVHTDNNYDDAAVQEVEKIADKQDATDALLETDSNTIVGAINEVNSIAKGANQALSFNDYQAVIAAMLVSGLNAGQNLYVDTLDVPDLWVKVVELTSVPYAYVSDEQFITDILAGTQIGYYRLALLETQKVDLTNYYTKDETDQAIEDYASPLGHDHKGEIINPDAVVLDKQYTDLTMVDLPIGAIFYNVDQLCWLLKLSDVNYYNLGEELPMLCKNGDAFIHVEGTPVYISSGSGQLALVQVTNSTIGKINAIATQDVLSSGSGRGYYCFFGAVRKFPYANVIKTTDNENTWVDGASLYLCSESGKFSTVKEDAPARSAKIGVITNRNGANITVMFTPEPCYSIDDLCDVDGTDTTIADTDEVLKKDTSGLWKKVTWANVKTLLNNIYGRLATTNTWSLLQTFTSGLKTTKIIPNSDTTGVVIRNAADGADVVKIDTENGAINLIESVSNLAGLGFGSDVRFYRSGIGTLSLSMGGIERMKWTIANGTGQFLMSGPGNATSPKYSFNDNQNSGFYMPSAAAIALSIAGVNVVNLGSKSGFMTLTPETTIDVNGTTTHRDWVYLNNGTHTGDAVGDKRQKVVSGALIKENCTALNATKGSGTWVVKSIEGAEKALTNTVSANILDINCAVNTMQCGVIEYSISAIDTASNTVRSHVGYMNYNVRNQNGTITTQLVHPATLENDLGIITDTWVLTNGTNKATLSFTANAAGMTPTSMTLYFDVKNQGRNTVTLL